LGTRVTRAVAHIPVEEVKRRMKMDPRSWVRERWGIIDHALMNPRKAEEIARDTGVSVTTVRRVISSYNRLGLVAIETPGKGGRRHEYMSVEQERSGSRSPFSRAPHTEKLPRRKKFSAPLKRGFSMRCISRVSIACWIVTAGASSCHVHAIPKPIQKHRLLLKKLCAGGSSSAGHTRS